MKELFAIYWVFLSMGAVTFGGGYTMLPILRREIVEKRGWLTEETILDYYALSQGLPGIIAINVSVFIGYQKAKFFGGLAAAFGSVTPCLVIISLLSQGLAQVQDIPLVEQALAGISIAVAALILDAVVTLWKKGVRDIFGVIICISVIFLTQFTQISPILLVIACALLGFGVTGRKKEETR